jgi:hypothetical protein
MDQDNRGHHIGDILPWVNQKWNDLLMLLTNWMAKKPKLQNPKSKLVEPSTLKEALDIECVYFGVGDTVRFASLVSDDESDWGLDPIDFKIFKGHLNCKAKIIEMHVKDHLPAGYNLFLTVKFDDGYVVDQVTHFAFNPVEPDVIDFVKEKERILKVRSENASM